MSQGDSALRHATDEMRLGRHPADQWEVDKWYWVLRTIEQYMAPSLAVRNEAWAEHKALKHDAPARPYERRERAVAG